MQACIILKADKEALFRRGHPWIFPKAIKRIQGKPKTGDWLAIQSEDNHLLGYGVYNAHSLYQVRVLAYAWEDGLDHLSAVIQARLNQALLLRRALNLPNPDTNAYRLFNSEADGLSGLTIDCFNDHLVIASSAYWVEAQRSVIEGLLAKSLPDHRQLWFSQEKPLQQDGWTRPLGMPASGQTEILEAGIRFQINFAKAQKTGLFIDQRENHQRIAKLAAGKAVLDLYSYTGGFALHAAKAGATRVTAVDSSAAAIEQGRENARLNGLDRIDWVCADAREHLSVAGDYDLIILDPPKLVPSKAHLNKARNYYRFLHREVFKAMRPGTLLLTCNCSSALSTLEFTQLVAAQGAEVGRSVRLCGVYGPAACHTTLAAFPEGQYLTAVLLAV